MSSEIPAEIMQKARDVGREVDAEGHGDILVIAAALLARDKRAAEKCRAAAAFYKRNDLYPAYGLNSRAEEAETLAAAIETYEEQG